MPRRVPVIVLLIMVACLLPLMQGTGSAAGSNHLTGTIFLDTGPELGNVTIIAVNTTNSSEVFSTTSNIDGFYDLSVPEGTYAISARMENYSIVASDGAPSYDRTVSGDTNYLNFTATELGVVSGFVDNVSAPIFDAKIVLIGVNSTTYYDYSSQPRGNYSITGVFPGVYTAHAEKSGYQTNYSATPITVAPGEITSLNFSLEAQPAELVGRVTFNGNPLEDVKVTIASGATVLYQTTTDAQGDYKISDITAGAYTITFTKETFEPSKFDNVQLTAFDNRKLDVSMERQQLPGGGGFISGFDLSHSLMVVGFVLAMITVVVALVIRYRVGKKPELLPEEEIEK